jgi:hypothetical protein
MDKMEMFLSRAANDLGLAIAVPFRCEIGNGIGVVAVAHLPELGGINGTLVFRSDQLDPKILVSLQNRGFACSSFDVPHESEEYDVEVYREMFQDWGWTDTSKEAPQWMKLEESERE